MIKKLRYYARFIVVSLLLKKMALVQDLLEELNMQIVDYANIYDPDDQMEWKQVVNEVRSFVRAESLVSVLHSSVDDAPIILTHR